MAARVVGGWSLTLAGGLVSSGGDSDQAADVAPDHP